MLTSVNQVEIIDNASLKSFSAPNLTDIGADLRIEGNGDLASVNLRNLRTVGEVVSIDFNGANASSARPLKLPSLTTVGVVLDIGFNANFSAIHVPVLTNVDRIEIIDNDFLRSISAPMLRDIGSMLQINDHRDLSALNLKALQTVGDLFQIRDNVSLCESIAWAIAARVTVPTVDIGGNRQHISCERRHKPGGDH